MSKGNKKGKTNSKAIDESSKTAEKSADIKNLSDHKNSVSMDIDKFSIDNAYDNYDDFNRDADEAGISVFYVLFPIGYIIASFILYYLISNTIYFMYDSEIIICVAIGTVLYIYSLYICKPW